MYKDKYRLVVGSGKDDGGKYVLVLRGIDKPVLLSHTALRIRSIKTGYVNVNGLLSYLSRSPARRYRQGLRNDNCTMSGRRDFRYFSAWVEKGSPHSNLPDGTSIISRNFAIVSSVLFYRKREVGSVVMGKPRLGNQFRFLSEAFNKAMSHGGYNEL